MLRLLILALVAAGIVLAGCGGAARDDANSIDGGEGDSDRADLTARLPAVSVAERLAAMDARSFRCAGRRRCPRAQRVSPGNALVLQFYTQLLNLRFKCETDRLGLLANHTVRAQTLLARQGVDESLLDIVSNVNGSIQQGAPRQPCSDPFAAYVSLRSVAEKLATIDTTSFICAGRQRCPEAQGVSPGDDLIVDFYTQFSNLALKCKVEKPSLLADYTVKAQKLLSKQGEDEGLISIIRDVNQSIPYAVPRQPCSDLFAAYVTSRTGG